jgi:zinc D-Ala-D-Ala carboxypeptidase
MSWENFTYDEFACQCGCGKNEMVNTVIDDLQALRTECGFPFIISSGYRCPDHPIEKSKSAPGPHSTGLAVDIALSHKEALAVFSGAVMTNLEEDEWVWKGFGVNQKGTNRFIHLDQCHESAKRPRPHLWSY